MIHSITVTNYLGDSIKLELTRPELSGFIVESITGLGPGKATVNISEVATNDGGLFNSTRLSARDIVLSLLFLPKETIEDVRQESYKYFPIKKETTLLIETDNRIAEITGRVESNDPKIFNKKEGTSITITCPDPYFYSAEGDGTQVTVFSGIEPMFEFPFSNESLTEPLLNMGNIVLKKENTINYTGDADTGITIKIHAVGAAKSITIYNVGTRESMRIDSEKIKTLTGEEIITGDDIIICTVKGKKSATLIRSGLRINILNCIDKNPDWFQLSKGDNIFAYATEGDDTHLQFTVENQLLYEGV